MVKAFVFLILLYLLFFPGVSFAEEKQHYTLIINQVRGEECCDKGSVESLKLQLEKIKSLGIKANFAVRHDALVDGEYTDLLSQHDVEIGGLLEITPSLAKEARVKYKGDENSWYEAQNVFLIGYSQDERKRIIDTFMDKFYKKYERYPNFTASWMIDAWSLRYLKGRYKVEIHQITREQFGTDSYTLWGGPVHYPYRSSENWALIPVVEGSSMPIIVRQTIMDPVYSYGDNSDSYTSQPNDYYIRSVGIDYFKHLFIQAHSQQNKYTFALMGLENSMAEEHQMEYLNQLDFVKSWQTENERNVIVDAVDFSKKFNDLDGTVNVYHGKSATDSNEQAFWINTNKYRARIRLSNNRLFVSDLRFYDSNFKDPYYEKPAGLLGWWITPFVLDGSRFFAESDSTFTLNQYNDSFLERPEKYAGPTNILIAEDINADDLKTEKKFESFVFLIKEEVVADFEVDKFFVKNAVHRTNTKIAALRDVKFFSGDQHSPWGVDRQGGYYYPYTNNVDLDKIRADWPSLLFPQLESGVISSKSELYVNNNSAIAGRNPIRLVFYPKDKDLNPVLLSNQLSVLVDNELIRTEILRPDSSNGVVYVDISSADVVRGEVVIKAGEYKSSTKISFAPDCKKYVLFCLLHPVAGLEHARVKIDDWLRERSRSTFIQEKFPSN